MAVPVVIGRKAAPLLAFAAFGAACGSRSGLSLSDDGFGDGGGTAGAGCAMVGEGCGVDADCCDAICVKGSCEVPPPACLGDDGPVLLVTGLVDPFAMASDSTSLFVGHLAAQQPLLRIPKNGDPGSVLVDQIDQVRFVVVRDDRVFISEQNAVSEIPVHGGTKTILVVPSGPQGLDVTARHVYVADADAGQLLSIDRHTAKSEVLGSYLPLPGIFRVAAAEDAGSDPYKGIVYFSDGSNGIQRYRLYDGLFDFLNTDLPPPHAVRIFDDHVYFTESSLAQVYRLPVLGADAELVADLSPFGVFPEALESDGEFLYLTLETGNDSGLIVRVPMGGGKVEVVADAQGPRPAGLVVDDACVYWAERDTGSVFRAPKVPQ